MTKETTNPFVLPGFGQQGDTAQNPLFAGLEMMNQAWQNMAQGNQSGATPTMSVDELDKKIRELRTVQNWLQLNSTMLSNTIQGLEIQRSTLAMMKSFATASTPADEDEEADNPDYVKAANEWWGLLQQQFEQMTKATTEGLQSMAQTADNSAAKPGAAAKKSTKSTKSTKAAKSAKASTSKTGAKSGSKSTRKS